METLVFVLSGIILVFAIILIVLILKLDSKSETIRIYEEMDEPLIEKLEEENKRQRQKIMHLETKLNFYKTMNEDI